MSKETEFQKVKDDVSYIKKVLAGNGETGLQKTVELLRETIENIQIVLVKLQDYAHLKNWIMGSVITVLASTTAFLLGIWIRGRL